MFGSIFYHTRRITETASDSISSARMAAEKAVMPVESRLDQLELACAGLWTLLQQKHGYTEEELIAAITEVDARDGLVDGRMGQASRTCPHCHRRLLARDSPKCSWCGCDLPTSPF